MARLKKSKLIRVDLDVYRTIKKNKQKFETISLAMRRIVNDFLYNRRTKMENTQDWSKFGEVEIEKAKELLSHIKEIDSHGKVAVEFNPNSGFVFLVDEDYRVWMMNDGQIQQFFSCPICGHEGFKDEMEHNMNNSECKAYLRDIGAIK